MNRLPHANIHRCAVLLLILTMTSSCDFLRSDSTITSENQVELARFDNADFVAGNPEYMEAVQLAFWLDGGLTVNPATALEFLRQREAIRYRYGDKYPETLRHFTQPFAPGRILAGIDTSYIAQAGDPQSGYYDPLPEKLRPDSIAVHSIDLNQSYSWFSAYFPKIYNPEVVAGAYAELPGMIWSEPSFYGTIGGNPFPVYPGIIDGEFYYIIRKISFAPERTSIFQVKPESNGLFRAELVASRSAGDGPWDDRFQEIVNEVHRQFRERYYDDSRNRESGKMEVLP